VTVLSLERFCRRATPEICIRSDKADGGPWLEGNLRPKRSSTTAPNGPVRATYGKARPLRQTSASALTGSIRDCGCTHVTWSQAGDALPKSDFESGAAGRCREALAIARLTCGVEGRSMRKVIMQNLPAQSVNAPEKVRCFRNNSKPYACRSEGSAIGHEREVPTRAANVG
jgi:hypothetical protein